VPAQFISRTPWLLPSYFDLPLDNVGPASSCSEWISHLGPSPGAADRFRGRTGKVDGDLSDLSSLVLFAYDKISHLRHRCFAPGIIHESVRPQRNFPQTPTVFSESAMKSASLASTANSGYSIIALSSFNPFPTCLILQN